ncbi:hypothetical protein Bca52824_024212 [Brassica carinata]|uniref:Uncharacterized protein n=1 Tax=Brassica carinata TaxID=52824 RepID=A0A8X8AU86_BRACI|nr:hypothetical protein Bca52824_024212 [Brassica carinata]
MGQDYSYTQPSESADYGLGDSDDSGYSTTEHAIMMDQAELQATSIVYPPQPEVDFGFPKECYCGGEPLLATSYSRNDPGRRIVDGLAKKRTRFGNGYELVLALLVGVVVIISVIVAARGC